MKFIKSKQNTYDQNGSFDTNPGEGGVRGEGSFVLPVGFPLITQKR